MTRPSRRRRWDRFRPRRPDVLGVTWVLLAIAAVLIPALLRGTSFGPYDLLSKFGLLGRPGVVPQNDWGGDLIDAIIPWQTLAWQQVHHGHLPLWNPYSGLGLPLAFNWQSGAFSLPVGLGYLAPVRLAFTVSTVVTLVVAGAGAYLFSRVLKTGALGAAVAGTVFALSGPMTAWAGFPHGSVISWAGWLFALALMMTTARNRVRNVVWFAVVLALAVYAGQPEILILMGLALGTFVVIVLAARRPVFGGSGPVLKPLIDLSLATVAGLCLAAPLALPGFALANESTRAHDGRYPALPARQLIYFITDSFDGAAVRGNTSFAHYAGFFGENLAYIGVISLVLAVSAAFVRYRSPEIVGLATVLAGSLAVLFVPFVARLGNHLPLLSTLGWHRILLVIAFVVAVLAGVGADILVRSGRRNRVLGIYGVGFAVVAGFLAAIWLFGRDGLTPLAAKLRTDSLTWPLVEAAAGIVVIGTLMALNHRSATRSSSNAPDLGTSRHRQSRYLVAGSALIVCQTVFLVIAGAPLRSSTSDFFAPTPAVTELRRIVGTGTVGFNGAPCATLGILPNVNVVYGVHEVDVYDPMIPSRYWSSWVKMSGQKASQYSSFFNLFCPRFSSMSLARKLGVQWVLVPSGSLAGPSGAVFIKKIGDESLVPVPGSGEATLTPLERDGSLPDDDRIGKVVRVQHPDPGTWRMTTNSRRASTLRLRITNLDGWHASIDGHDVPLATFAGLMFQAKVPAGRHVVTLTYWPDSFRLGLLLASAGIVGLSTAVIVSVRRRRRSPTPVDDLRQLPPALKSDHGIGAS